MDRIHRLTSIALPPLALAAALAVLALPSLAAADGALWNTEDVFARYVSVGVEAGAVTRDLPACTRCDGASFTLGLDVQLGVVARIADGSDTRRNGAALVLELSGQTIPVGSADDERRAVQLAELAVVQIWPRRWLRVEGGIGGAQLVNDGAPGTNSGLALRTGAGVALMRRLDLQARLGFHWFGDDGHTTVATLGVGVHRP